MKGGWRTEDRGDYSDGRRNLRREDERRETAKLNGCDPFLFSLAWAKRLSVVREAGLEVREHEMMREKSFTAQYICINKFLSRKIEALKQQISF